jgi:hypothetical protein
LAGFATRFGATSRLVVLLIWGPGRFSGDYYLKNVPRPNRLHPMTESEEAFARRAVRRKGLFLKLSVASLIVAAGLVVLYSIFWWRDHSYPVGPRAVIILLILLNARQNLRQYRYAGVLEQLLPPDATLR